MINSFSTTDRQHHGDTGYWLSSRWLPRHPPVPALSKWPPLAVPSLTQSLSPVTSLLSYRSMSVAPGAPETLRDSESPQTSPSAAGSSSQRTYVLQSTAGKWSYSNCLLVCKCLIVCEINIHELQESETPRARTHLLPATTWVWQLRKPACSHMGGAKNMENWHKRYIPFYNFVYAGPFLEIFSNWILSYSDSLYIFLYNAVTYNAMPGIACSTWVIFELSWIMIKFLKCWKVQCSSA